MGVNNNLLSYRVELYGVEVNLGIFLASQVTGRNYSGICPGQVSVWAYVVSFLLNTSCKNTPPF